MGRAFTTSSARLRSPRSSRSKREDLVDRVKSVFARLLHVEGHEERVDQDRWRAGRDSLERFGVEALGLGLLTVDDQGKRGALSGRLLVDGERGDTGFLRRIGIREPDRAARPLESLGGLARLGLVRDPAEDLCSVALGPREDETPASSVDHEARRAFRRVPACDEVLPLQRVVSEFELALDVLERLARGDDADRLGARRGPDKRAVQGSSPLAVELRQEDVGEVGVSPGCDLEEVRLGAP